MLPNFDLVLRIFEVLCVNNVNLELRVDSDAHGSHELSLSLHGFLELELNLFLLTVVIDDVSHDFLLSFLQFVLSVDVLQDEFFNGNFAVIVQVDLVEDLIDNLVAHVFIEDLLITRETECKFNDSVTYLHLNEILVQLGARDDSILVGVDHVKLLAQLPFHVVLQACLLDSLINRVGI